MALDLTLLITMVELLIGQIYGLIHTWNDRNCERQNMATHAYIDKYCEYLIYPMYIRTTLCGHC